MNARLRAVALVTNIPGPLAAHALARDGFAVTKVEPPQGDPLSTAAPAWYEAVTAGLEVLRMDLRDLDARERVESMLGSADLLITAMRASALDRLGIGWGPLHDRHPRLCHVAVVGEAAPHDDRAGHDLTYQAQAGLVYPPVMPRSVFADLFAAERAVAAAYRLVFERERTGKGSRVEIAIANGASALADPIRFGLTTPDGPLGGALPVYRLYEAADGWIALAALEPHFQARLRDALRIDEFGIAELSAKFAEGSCAYWEDVARQHDLPLRAVVKA